MSLVALSLFAGLGGALFGYDLGVIGGALLGMAEDLDLDLQGGMAASFIVGAFKLGAFFGTFLGGAAMLRYGRRPAIALSSIFTTLGPVIMSLSLSTSGLVVGRLVGGLGIGSCAIIIPTYLSEIAPVKHRGAVVQVYEMMVCLGMLAAMLMDWALEGVGSSSWRWMVGVPALPSAVMALAMFVLPESPRWLVMRGECGAALATLKRVLGGASGPGGRDAAEEEMMSLRDLVEQDKAAAVERRRGNQHKGADAADDVSLEPLLLLGQANANDLELSELSGSRERGATAPGDSRGPNPRGTCSLDLGPSVAAGGHRDPSTTKYPVIGAAAQPGHGSSTQRDGQHQEISLVVDGRSLSRTTSFEPLLSSDPTAASTGSNPKQAHSAVTLPGCEPSFLHTLAAMLADIVAVARGDESRAFVMAMWLAFFDQANASSAIINFAPSLLVWQGADSGRNAMLLSASVALTKTLGVLTGLMLVDRLGRRPLLIWGAYGCATALVLMTAAATITTINAMVLLLVSMCLFILAFSVSWAGLYWVLVSELFSMSAKSPASSAATAFLFLTGSVTNVMFLSLVEAAGAYTFLLFAGVAAASGWFVWSRVPETKGCTTKEIQALLASKPGNMQS